MFEFIGGLFMLVWKAIGAAVILAIIWECFRGGGDWAWGFKVIFLVVIGCFVADVFFPSWDQVN